MNIFRIKNWLNKTLVLCALGVTAAHAAEPAPVIIGKDNWLFTPYEFAKPDDQQDTAASIELLQKTNRLFEGQGITLALVMIPSKIRIYADQLPDSAKLDKYTAEKYENILSKLHAGGLNTIGLNQVFLNSPKRISDTPLFLQLDSHWAPAGALLAAETVKAGIDANPALKTALAATPEEKHNLSWSDRKINQRARDLVKLLPRDAQNYPPEQTLLFKAVREKSSQADLLSAGENVGVTVIGSSYTHKNTGFPDGLRYTLQRNLLDISIPVDQGPWVGMEAYLRDDAFKTNKPKLIIWEIPEREMRSPPNYKYRDARYIMDNNEWFSRISALLK